MIRSAPLLARLRHSLLGAWFAVGYALLTLAAAIVPAPVHAALDGTVLCSGAAIPGEPPPAGGDDRPHCKTCPPSPLPMALGDLPRDGDDARIAVRLSRVAASTNLQTRQIDHGLPPSRAPPQLASD